MNYEELLIKIDIPKEIHNILIKYKAEYQNTYQDIYNELKSQNANYDNIKSKLNDDNGLKILSIYLLSALDSYKKYKELNITDEIFISTFKAYGRFINESYKFYNDYIFDRHFWTYRENELHLFRLGKLEFELLDKEITIHIPSDAKIDEESFDKSILLAHDFFEKYFAIPNDYPYSLSSWLLSPALKLILNEDSNIIKLQNKFKLNEIDEKDNSYLIWIFKTTNPDIMQLPANTSLQKGIKRLLKENIKIGSAKGYLLK